MKIEPVLQTGHETMYLGRVLTKVEGGFAIRPSARLINSYLEALNLKKASPVTTPCTKQEMRRENEKELDPEGASLVRKAVGILLFIAHDRADIAYATKEISRGMKTPTDGDLVRLKRVGRYLVNKKDYKLNLVGNLAKDGIVDGFGDSDWATDKVTRRSTSGGMLLYADALVLSFSRTQTTVATSSAEAELYSTGSIVCEGMLCAAILKELNDDVLVKIHSDSTAGISAQSRLGLGKMKHVEVRYLFVQGLLRRGRMSLHKVGTLDNMSDIATKPIDQKTLERHCRSLGLVGDEDHTSLMQISGERQRTNVLGDLSRLAGMAGQCGSCLVGLAALLTKADASEIPKTGDQEESDGNLLMKVAVIMLVMWTTIVVLTTLRMTQRTAPPPLVVKTIGTQTGDEWMPIAKIPDMTIQSIRHELSRLQLPTDGVKAELVARLTRAMFRV